LGTTTVIQTVIHVVGIGLDGAAGLTESVRQLIQQASLLVGSDRHLNYFPNFSGDRIILGSLSDAIAHLKTYSKTAIVLTSGDPLFFGLGRLLLEELPAETLTFHPHLSSIQLAFSRVKLPWQDARVISAHGRSFDELIQALQQGTEKIAVLTDATHSPAAIAQLIESLELPSSYKLWVCENLGAKDERIFAGTESLSILQEQSFASLNVVILQRQPNSPAPENLPLFGISDQRFLSFSDRPGLMTKREVRVLALAELELQPKQTVWDIGAGTGSVAIEIARLCPTSQIYAIEKTAAGVSLISQNCDRFQVTNIKPIQGSAPTTLESLPSPDRIFIGGTGGNLTTILNVCITRLRAKGVIVLAIATLENLTEALTYLKAQGLSHRLMQVQIARSTAIAALTRFTPLNPVTLIRISQD
jgi:precorrin-6B C5,15-methyltransferase / cobalt-precorrin-6B C5,C15-methyltransferase